MLEAESSGLVGEAEKLQTSTIVSAKELTSSPLYAGGGENGREGRKTGHSAKKGRVQETEAVPPLEQTTLFPVTKKKKKLRKNFKIGESPSKNSACPPTVGQKEKTEATCWGQRIPKKSRRGEKRQTLRVVTPKKNRPTHAA